MGSSPGSGRSPGEGSGNPVQCSCLENPMDRGAWWATVHGVANSWTRLKQFSPQPIHFCYHLPHWQPFEAIFSQCQFINHQILEIYTWSSFFSLVYLPHSLRGYFKYNLEIWWVQFQTTSIKANITIKQVTQFSVSQCI